MSEFGVLAHVLLQILCHRDLVVQVKYRAIVLLAAVHDHPAGCRHVGQEVLTLVVGDVAIDVAQFLREGVKTLVDEVGGAFRHAVLVPEPTLVIHVDEGEDDVGGACGNLVLYRQLED